MRRTRIVTLSSLLLLSAVFVFTVAPASVGQDDESLRNAVRLGKAFTAVAKKASPAVVFIQVEKVLADRAAPHNDPFDLFNDEFFRRFFQDRMPRRQNPPRQFRQKAQGSGFIISSDGYILTNNHVVGGADKVQVKMADGRQFDAKVVGADPETDIALLKIDGSGLPTLPLGSSSSLEVGEWVIAIGNPFGLSHTVTAGIVSAKGRSNVGIASYEDFIQTDAAINPGNSGGPLINLDGKVVGINTAIFSRSGGYMGIGFAIPVDQASVIYRQLKEHGSVTRGFLGVVVQDLTPELMDAFDLKKKEGVLISEVTPDSPADRSGLKHGDVILKLDGKSVKGLGSFRNRVALFRPGTKIQLKIVRKGEEKEVSVTIGTLADRTAASENQEILKRLGMTIRTLDADSAKKQGYEGEEGVLVTKVEPGSLAAFAGIRPGVLIVEANRRKVRTVQEFQEVLARSASPSILMLIRDGEVSRYVALRFK